MAKSGCHERSEQSRSSIGKWYGAGSITSWLHSASPGKSFALMKHSVKATEVFYLDDKRNAQRYQWDTNWRHKNFPDQEKVWDYEIWIRCCTTVLFLSILFDFSSATLEFSLFLCSFLWRLTLVDLDSSFKIDEFLHEVTISLKN